MAFEASNPAGTMYEAGPREEEPGLEAWTGARLSAWLQQASRDHELAVIAMDPNSERAPAANLVAEIEELANFEDDWDMHGASRVHRNAIENAASFAWKLGAFASQFEPFADPDGSAGLEGHTAKGDVYLSFAPSGRVAYVVKTKSGMHRGYGADESVLRQLLAGLL